MSGWWLRFCISLETHPFPWFLNRPVASLGTFSGLDSSACPPWLSAFVFLLALSGPIVAVAQSQPLTPAATQHETLVQVQAQSQVLAQQQAQQQVQLQTVPAPGGTAPFPQYSDKSPPEHCPEAGVLSTDADAKRFLSVSESDQDSEIAVLRGHEALCMKVPEYYAHLGQYLLLSKKPSEAMEALERSLLLKSDQPGVQLDFALSLGLGGDIDSANALVTQVLGRDDVPEGLRHTLNGLLTKGWAGVDRSKASDLGSSLEPSQSLLSFYGRNADLTPNGFMPMHGLNPGSLPGNLLAKVSTDGTSADPSLQKASTLGLSMKPASSAVPGPGIKQGADGWQWSGSLQSMLGRDSNLNSASYTSTINLTLPNGIVPLALDASSLPQAGPTQVFAAQGLAQRTIGERVLSLGGTWMDRQTPNGPALGLRNRELSLQIRPKSDLGWSQRAVLTHFELGGANFFNGLTFTMWKEWLAPSLEEYWGSWTKEGVTRGQDEQQEGGQRGALKASSDDANLVPLGSDRSRGNSDAGLVCRYLTGLEADRRTYAQDNSQDGAYRGVLVGVLCNANGNQLNVVAHAGTDWASDMNRAGGNQQRQELKVQWARSWGLGRLGLEWSQQRLLDAQIYSELLGGVVRNTTRENFRMTWDYKVTEKLVMIGGSLHWVSFWEALQYRSSVDLFNLKGQSVQTGLTWDF